MNLQEVRSRVELLSLFKAAPPALKRRIEMILLAISDYREMGTGTTIYREGQPGDGTGCILLDGTVQVQKREGETIEVRAPQLLGEMQRINPSDVRTATVITLTPARALLFTWQSFFGEAHSLLNDSERAKLEEILGEIAWSHFVGS